jgi:probable HAF family extracellular repeat protein
VWTEAAGATLLPHLDGNSALDVFPWALNDAGVVVGMAEVSNHVWRAFVWDAESGIRDLNAVVTVPPNFILDRAIGINDRGWIVGDGHFGPNWSSSQAFVLIPRTEAVLDVTPPLAGGLALRVRPNPSPGPATIDYALETAGSARIRIFDLRGRMVAERLEPEQSAGAHVARWDGRDPSGRLVPPGAYVIRLDAGGRTVTRRLSLIR